MIVGTLPLQGAQHAVEAPGTASGVASLTPPTASQVRPGVIGGVGIEPRLDGAGGQRQSLLAHGHLQCLQVQFVDGLAPEESLNFVPDVGGQQRGEGSFF